MKGEYIKLRDIRVASDVPMLKQKIYERLILTILNFPEMLSIRPPVVDEKGVCLGQSSKILALRDIKQMKIEEISHNINTGNPARDAELVGYWVQWKKNPTVLVSRIPEEEFDG